MDKNERLLDLIALFLDARTPVSWATLRDMFPDEYGQGSEESAARKFERDKADLADLGISLTYHPAEEDGPEGYLLAREDYYLPKIDFTPEEMAVLYAAGSAALASGAFPGRSDLSHALRKIAFVSRDDPESVPARLYADLGPEKAGLGERLETLWQALLQRKRVVLRYRGAGREEETVRDVDPWGVCLRRGVWVLVGYCHLRRARRTFHLDRIVAVAVNKQKPRSPDYEVPADFSIEDVAAEQVWEHRFHEPVDVELRLAPELAPLAARLFPNARVDALEGNEARVLVTAHYLDGLLRRVLPLGDGARVIGPEQARTRAREMYEAIARAHADAPAGGEEKLA